MTIPKITLQGGIQIPQIGLGLWQVKDQTEFDQAFDAAITAGYRHFDSAQAYDNEQMLGSALQRTPTKREDIFITTKIGVTNFGYKRAQASFESSLNKLQTDYVDLLLLHFPVSLLRKKSWQALEELHESGKARSIGVSNYTIRHLEEMKSYAKIMPALNQVELHVFLQQPELIAYCRDHNIVVEAYSPLAHGKAMNEPLIKTIAEKHGKTYAQIMLRWCIEKGLIIIPKSVKSSRIQENIAIFDFSLDNDDLEKLATLDSGLRTCWDPTLVP